MRSLLIFIFIAVVLLLLFLLGKTYYREMYVLILPRLETLEELRRSEWYGYLCDVYRCNVWTTEDLPVDMSTFQFLYFSKIPASVRVPRNTRAYRGCPQVENQLYTDMPGPHNPPDSLYIYKPPPYPALAPHTWVEVAHCIQETEAVGCWFYYLPGTGIYFNLGKTIAFADHRDAALFFLGEQCPDTECSADIFTKMFTEAKNQGFDSVQFLRHDDMRCGNTAVEIVHVRGRGSDTCCGDASAFRTGWKAKYPSCHCDSTLACLNCAVTA